MRRTVSKKLHALAGVIAASQKLPDLVYNTQEVLKTIILPGPTRRTVVIEVKSLGKCKRKIYKTMKRIYKEGGLINAQGN